MNNCAVIVFLVVAFSGYIQLKNKPNDDILAQNAALMAKLADAQIKSEKQYQDNLKALAEEKKRLESQCSK